MANFAELNETNEIINVIVVASDDFTVDGVENEEAAKDLLEGMYGHRRWVQTSYTSSIRGRYASIGGTYNKKINKFIDPAPYPSWKLNAVSGEWEPPVAAPADTNNSYSYWDEETTSWKIVDADDLRPKDSNHTEAN